MKNLKDTRTKIYPSTTRGGKELPSSSSLDSPSVLSKLATPKPASAINSDMSHIIDDATYATHDTYDESPSMLDSIVPLGEFLDEQLDWAIENEIIETDNIDESDDEASPSGSPGLGGLRTAGLYPLAGLLDYEDTSLKTSSRVWMGLYLAWKAR